MYQNRAAGYTFAIREANTVFSFGGMTAVLCSLQSDNQLLYGNRKMMKAEIQSQDWRLNSIKMIEIKICSNACGLVKCL